MWVPVLESAKLGKSPARVQYWGTPVVLFRTASGRIGALEDLCGHRGVPLSCGAVRGEDIRCAFHHFRFGVDGACVDVPKVFGTDETFKESCRVRRFFVREAISLIWISIEDEPDAPFPIDETELPSDPVVMAGSFDVDGDIRVWMDHFLDVAHCIWTHAETAYAGSPDRPAELASVAINIDQVSQYPVRRAIEMTFRVPSQGRAISYALPMRLVFAGTRLRDAFIRSRRGGEDYLRVRADLVTPLCQETWSGVGPIKMRVWTGITPVAHGKNRFLYGGIAGTHGAGRIGRWLARRLLADFVQQHLQIEDGRLLALAQFVAGDRFRATPLDATVQEMRSLFAAYQKEKAHLYPPDSLMRRLEYGAA